MHGDERHWVDDAILTNWVSTVGANINEVEKQVAARIGVNYAVALSCGTAALHLATKLAGEKLYGQARPNQGTLQGHRVFCSDMTFDASINPVAYEDGEAVFIDKAIDRHVCSFGNPVFWRVDRETFIANVGVTLCLDTGKGFRNWDGFLSLWFHMGEKVTCSIEYLGAMDELADEELPMLSSYLVPIFSNRQMDEEAEAIWARYLPEALRDSEKRSAVTLAKKMGLTIQYQPVYRHKDTASILFFEEGELAVKDELAENASETKPTCVKIPANTIVINTNAVQQRYAGFHIYHEYSLINNSLPTIKAPISPNWRRGPSGIR